MDYPIERDVDVITVMAATSAVHPQATLIYPPIGPYSSGIIETFDPSIEEDRIKAKQIFCEEGGCDLSLRITQGGERIRVYAKAILGSKRRSNKNELAENAGNKP